jgi:hypothetical protein
VLEIKLYFEREKLEDKRIKTKGKFANEKMNEIFDTHRRKLLDEGKWIEVDITIMTPFSELIKLKSALKPYAEELGWKLESESETDTIDNIKVGGKKIARINVTLSPKNKVTSPINFLNMKRKIMGLVFSINRDSVHEENHKEAVKDFLHKKTLNRSSGTYVHTEYSMCEYISYSIRESTFFLNYSYKLKDRIKLEKGNKKLALELFGKTAEEDIKFFLKEEPKEERKSKIESEEYTEIPMKKELKDLFGFDIL